MINIRQEVDLFPYNTFGIPATASMFVEVDCVDEVSDFLKSLADPSIAFILGGGSNVLFVADRCEVVVHPVFKGIELIDETADSVLIRAGAGEVWDDFVQWCVDRHYSGVENLSHIPGLVGACPIQNIGAYGVEVKDVVESVEAMELVTGQVALFSQQQCQFGYRDSFFKQHKRQYFVTAVQFRLSKKFVPNVHYVDLKMELSRVPLVTLESIRQAVIHIRNRKLPDPSKIGNAGSFFKNPTISTEKSTEISKQYHQVPLYPVTPDFWKISAAWLIQQCGWKGIREGQVGTYPSQPLVIVNYGGATGKEILDFSTKIIDSVHDKFGIRLEPEVNIL